ncbi:hypothetical protein [uncultured Modestobacter sp.]|uniref:hypothetical protein n=1 Tax=uncultured Modestobacter sp. TaxID=380048 RepID=UPI00261D200D|nr:hypothetical protein [uncultured Modestobacter sp.]
MTITGEKQLLALKPEQLKVIDLMLSSDMYALNEALRTGQGLDNGPGPLMDYSGYSSNREFHRDALTVFASLASSLTINGQVQLYRGIRHINGPHNLAATMQTMLNSNTVPTQHVLDPGYGFAVTDPAVAISYARSRPHAPSTAVLLQLTADRGLCIPEPPPPPPPSE